MKVMIMGVGTLGKALARVVAAEEKHELILVDSNEWTVAEVQREFPKARRVLMDMSEWNYNELPCDMLIVTAAFKHVTLCEDNPSAAIQNNLVKTEHVFREASKNNVQFLFTGTDKAVAPVSVYGWTKALGERLAWAYGGQVSRTGNIIGSSGSAIPLWETQIQNRKPITITDFSMVRYIIDEERAAKEIWAGFKLGANLIIPKNMKKITVRDMIDEVLKRHGHNSIESYPAGYEVIGARPGEKHEEALAWEGERINALPDMQEELPGSQVSEG